MKNITELAGNYSTRSAKNQQKCVNNLHQETTRHGERKRVKFTPLRICLNINIS